MGHFGATNVLRWIGVFTIIASLVGSVGLSSFTPAAFGQDSGGADIGDAPIASSVVLSGYNEPGQIELASGGGIDPASRDASRDYFYANFQSSIPAVNWTGSYGSCTPGAASSAHQQALLNQMAYYRAMAGVPADIVFASEYNAKAQRAALMMGAAQSLSHSPQPGWPCYTADGAQAAANSNLYYRVSASAGASGPDPITSYMEDAGSGNTSVGHRRWILYPQTSSFGSGAVQGLQGGWQTYANTLWVMDNNVFGPRPATRDGFVAWPPPGYVPYQVTFPRWSFSYPGANFAGTTVTATKDGNVPISVLVESRTANGYGENTLVWSMEGLSSSASWPKPNSDSHYTITLTNVIIGGAPTSFTYTVSVFDPATAGASAEVEPVRAVVGSPVAFLLTGFPANTSITVNWKRPTGTIEKLPGTFTTDEDGNLAASFNVPIVPGGGGHQIFFSETNGATATAWFEVTPRISIAPNQARRGETIDVSLRGFAKQETVQIRWKTTGGGWTQVAEAQTSNSGSVNLNVVVPDFASDGMQVVRAEGSTLSAQTSSVEVQGAITPPTVSISPERSTVNNWIIYAVSDFPPNSTVTISWTRLSGGTISIGSVQVDGSGAASGQFRVPATPGGPNQKITFSAGSVQATATFDVAARIKVNTNPAVRGTTADVSLRGYGKNETVRIRWLLSNGQWVDVAQVVTSNTGSANVAVVVPGLAPDGPNSVRGDGTQFRQQTNAVTVNGGPVTTSNVATATPTPTLTATAFPEATVTVSPVVTETVEATPTPGLTPVPTEIPIETPTPEPTVDPGTSTPESP